MLSLHSLLALLIEASDITSVRDVLGQVCEKTFFSSKVF